MPAIHQAGARFQTSGSVPGDRPRSSIITRKTYQCIVCGFVYEESIGMPDEGVAAGTRWADSAEDWECPGCGVAKSDVEMVEI